MEKRVLAGRRGFFVLTSLPALLSRFVTLIVKGRVCVKT